MAAEPGATPSSLLTPPQPSRIKRALPEQSPFTTFLKHLPDLTPPRAATYSSYSSFAFMASPTHPRLASHQTPAKSRSGDQDAEAAPFANILTMPDLRATPVKAAPEEADGFTSYRGGSETPYGLRSPIPLFHQSPRRPGPSGGSPTPGSKLSGGGGGPPTNEPKELRSMLGSPPRFSGSAFAALLDGHSRSSPGGGPLALLGPAGGGGAGPSGRSFSGLFSPAKRAGSSQGGGGSGSERGGETSQRGGGGGAEAADRAAEGSGAAAEAQSLGRGAATAIAAAAAVAGGDSQPGSDADGPPARSGGSSGSEQLPRRVPPPPPFFSPLDARGASNDGGAGGAVLERGGSFRSVGGTSDRGTSAAGSGSDSEREDDFVGDDDDEDDEDYTEGEASGGGGGRLSRARRRYGTVESPRLVRRRRPGEAGSGAGGSYGRMGLYGGAPGAPQRRPPSRGGSGPLGDYATDDDAEPTPLVHAMLPQSPMCVPLNLDTFLPIPKLRSDDRLAEAAGGGSPRHRSAIKPLPLDSPAVKAAANAAITAALEAAVGPASSSGASGSARSARGDRAGGAAARAAAAAAAVAGTAPLTRRQSSHSSARAPPVSILPPAPVNDEALLARMLQQSNKKCNCKKSKCLKLYCDCFAGGGFCGPQCSCVGCSNRTDNLEVVKAARDQIASRNPNAFKEKIEADPSLGGQHRRGCNCKKSHCMKKYCECFSAGVPCGEHCKCEGCHNTPDAFKRQPPGRGRRGGSAAAVAAGGGGGAGAAAPLSAATAAAMRAGIPMMVLPPGARGMGMPAAAAVAGQPPRPGQPVAAGGRGAASDAAAALALGSALQFMLPMGLQQQAQQAQQAAAATVAAGEDSATPRAGAPGADAALASDPAGRQATPSPAPQQQAGAAGAGAASPQLPMIFSMLQPGAAAAEAGGATAPGMLPSNGTFFLPLMWPFGNASGAAGSGSGAGATTPAMLPLNMLPPELQADPAAAMKYLQQQMAQQAQQQQQPAAMPAQQPAAPAPADATMPAPPLAPPAQQAQQQAGAEAGAMGSPLSPLHPSPSFSFQMPGAGGRAAQTSPAALPGVQAVQAGRASSPQLEELLAGGSSGSGDAGPALGAGSGGGGLPEHLEAGAAGRPRPSTSPAAVSDMDLVLDSPRAEGISSAAAALTPNWLQLGAIGGGFGAGAGAQRAPLASFEEPSGSGLEPQGSQPSSSDGGEAFAGGVGPLSSQEGPATRKRTRSAAAAAAAAASVHSGGESDQSGGGGAVERAQQAPLSPRATPTKRKPLRTITSALM